MHQFVLLDVASGDGSGHGRGDLDRSLVRLDFHERSVLQDGLPCAHVQLDHLAFVDPLTQIGKLELDGHGGTHSQASVSCTAAMTSSASGRKCFSVWK